MPFKKSNSNYDENIYIKDSIENLPRADISLVGIFYLEYRIKYYKANEPNVKRQCTESLRLFYDEVQSNNNFDDCFYSFTEFCYKLAMAQRKHGWESLECVINSFNLASGQTGNIGYKRKAEVIEVIRMVIEQYYELGVTEILRSLDG